MRHVINAVYRLQRGLHIDGKSICRSSSGFTLIELSIVLVVVALIISGVLVGQDMITAARVRTQVSQIEKYNSAVNTFRGKYGALPGDIANGADYGFPASGGVGGQGDGNGIIEGYKLPWGTIVDDLTGEALVFWVDLSMSGLIDSTLTVANYTTDIRYPNSNTLYPAAKINPAGFIFAWSYQSINYFTIHGFPATGANNMSLYPPITPIQASALDTKIDDGLPTKGRVTAKFVYSFAPFWSLGAITPGNPTIGWAVSNFNLNAARLGSATTCFDNNNVANGVMLYSILYNGGNGLNCTLSFQFN